MQSVDKAGAQLTDALRVFVWGLFMGILHVASLLGLMTVVAEPNTQNAGMLGGFLFALLVGYAFSIWWYRDYRNASKRRARAKQLLSAGTPWLLRDDWAQRRVRPDGPSMSRNASRLLYGALTLLSAALVTGALAGTVYAAPDGDPVQLIFIWVVPLLSIIGVVTSYSHMVHPAPPFDHELELAEVPVGHELVATLTGVAAPGPLTCTLTRYETSYGPGDDGVAVVFTRQMSPAWRTACEVAQGDSVVIRATISEDAPRADLETIRWELSLSTATQRACWELPVF